MAELLLYTFYGDDFTGSTDVLDALASNGIETVLFLAAPTERQRAAFPHAKAIGIAGSSRSQTPEWMDKHLPQLFRALKDLNSPITHYKTCSTFDSAPHIGNIGRALELGYELFASDFIPVVVAAPHLGRYVLFSNLFADAGGQIYRIDHHLTMRNHPITPMQEADLRRHLAIQTAIPISSIDIRAFEADTLEQALAAQLNAGFKVILFDGLDEATAAQTGRLLWSQAEGKRSFAVGSSGLTYALIHEWRARNLIAPAPTFMAPCTQKESTRPIVVLSGSCSPATAAQIEWAITHGFMGIALDPVALVSENSEVASRTYLQCATEALRRGQSIVLYTALGSTQAEVQGEALGTCMGLLLRELILATGVRRVAMAGGDTSSHAIAQLGLQALTFAARLQPGAPLCRAHSPNAAFDGLELVLKGGQIGTPDFFGRIRIAG